VCRSLQV